jgi:hypothetical protein
VCSWLHREDFTSRFIITDRSISDGTTLMASTNWRVLRGGCAHGDRVPAREAQSAVDLGLLRPVRSASVLQRRLEQAHCQAVVYSPLATLPVSPSLSCCR